MMSAQPPADVTAARTNERAESADETASVHVCRDVPRLAPDVTAGRARMLLIGHRYESAADIAVCDGDRFVGLVPIEVALSAPNWERLGALMDPDPPVVAPGTDQEVAAWKAIHHGETSLAVVDAEGRFVGLVPPRRLLAVLLAEHDEDLARLSGFAASTRSARRASEEPVAQRLAHRLPWLLVGLAGSLLAAGIVGRFERELETTVALAFFVPGIVYMADAVGTQTEALVIRGLSVGVPIRRVIRNELLTGLLVGLTLATAFLPLGLILWDDGEVALSVAIALLAACSTATIVAMVLPWALHRAGADPAFGSGPLATVLQDLLSLVIYFTVAAAIVS
jgi:magnesium transporter